MAERDLDLMSVLIALLIMPANLSADTVVIDGRDSAVEDRIVTWDETEFNLSELIAGCGAETTDRGEYFSCVTVLTNALLRENVITGKEKGAIQRCAMKATRPSTGATEVSAIPASEESVVTPLANMIFIESGTFTMGDRSNPPAHEVTLTRGFWMGIFEVTQAEYEAVIGSNPSFFPGNPNHPVETVSWTNAVDYCSAVTTAEQSAGKIPTDWSYRLPTEAEWEYSCRAGTTTTYSFGRDRSDLDLYGWYKDNSGDTTHPVGEKLPNPWGLYDMHGNVQEWCQDFFDDYPAEPVTDPKGPESGQYHVRRSGGWSKRSRDCSSTFRNGHRHPPIATPKYRYGFRIVLAQDIE